MKSLYESLLTGKVNKPSAKEQPSSKKELEQLIDEYIEALKPRPGQEVDLNWIDISRVDDLSFVFADTKYIPVIDTWKIDHVKKFRRMFARNEHIKRSPLPVLQENLLSLECYVSMFEDCTSLIETPELPAKTLTKGCYMSMFENCKKLKVTPQLPVKELKTYCYAGMFNGCSSLEHAPELPAIELAPGCYEYMFNRCSSLEHAPELPAMKLALSCYRCMFAGCTSLEVAPELPAIQPVKDCYDYMFADCVSLENKAKVPAEVDMNNTFYTYKMYENCPKIKD